MGERSSGEVELAARAGEVLVELAADEVGAPRHAEDARAEVGGELVERIVGAVGDAAEPAAR